MFSLNYRSWQGRLIRLRGRKRCEREDRLRRRQLVSLLGGAALAPLEAVRLIDGEHKSLLRAFRIEQSWARVINKINNLFGARKGLVRLVEHGPNAAKLRESVFSV